MFKYLSQFQKFKKGSFLWLIFFEPKRNLFKQINWRTGFLLHKLGGPTNISKPIIIDTQDIFLNHSLLCLPLKKQTWSSNAFHYWKQMDKPSFRVFIPLGESEEPLNKCWPLSDKVYNLSYYKEAKL